MGGEEASAGGLLSDPELVQACLAGDRAAWDEVVARYGRLVYAIPFRCGLDASDADDVFQNVFTILLRRLEGLRDQTRLSSWLITTTYRESWRHSREKRRGGPLDEDLVHEGAPPLEEVVRGEREQQVREALSALDDRCQALLTALFLDPDEADYATIADRLGMPIGSIGPTRARCFRKLETALAELGFETDS